MALGILSREAIEQAIAEYDQLGRHAFLSKHGYGRATSYTLDVNGHHYDPKAIAGVAYGLDHPEEVPLKNTNFNGGLQLRSAFRPAGFDVVLRTTPGRVELKQSLERLMDAYPSARAEPYRGDHPIQAALRSLVESLSESAPLTARPDIRVKGSAGLGNWAAVPWIAFLDKRVTTSTQSGVYPVALFLEDMSGLYLTLAQGTQQLKQQGRAYMLGQLHATAARIRGLAGLDLEARGFSADNKIALGVGALARDYQESTIVHKFYARDAIPDDAEILRDLDAVLDLSDANIAQVLDLDSSLPDAASLSDVAAAFRAAVDSSGMRVRSGHGDAVRSLVAALVSKPFVIFSGLSGSGKTQLAMRLGEWFGTGPHGRRFLPVPVRPDWTGPEALFGYEDALRPAKAGMAAWYVPSPLSFLLAAARDPELPYLLLLDEMNLAHVERYFSDFLSGMETREAVLPNLSKGDDGEWRLEPGADALIPIPRNVFVVGTVNVDETTYQFSPKVLDRATTFEVRTRTEELTSMLVRPTAVAPGLTSHLHSLVNHVLDDTWQSSDPGQVAIRDALRDLHRCLTESDDEFGFRVFYESLRLAAALALLGVTERNAVLDHVVLLKILPRIHGSRRRAEPVLRRLAAYATDPDARHGVRSLGVSQPSVANDDGKGNTNDPGGRD